MADGARLVEMWVAVDPSGGIDLDRLCWLKRDCRLTAREKKIGWTVRLATIAIGGDRG